MVELSVEALELPQYQSHKVVRAVQIGAIDLKPAGGAVITPENESIPKFKVEAEYMAKHGPKVGGYFVLYEDGYKSYSPKDAFEGGYRRIVAGHSLARE